MRWLLRSQEPVLRDRTSLRCLQSYWSGISDPIAFSTVILHELVHVIDRVKNWTKYFLVSPLDQPETLEYEADDLVATWGWKDGLIETLQLTIARRREHGMPGDIADKRLFRLSNPAQLR